MITEYTKILYLGAHFSSLQQIFLASEKEEGANKKESNKKEKKNEDYLERKVRPVELLTGLRCNEGHLCSDKLMHARYTINFGMLVDLATKSA